MSAKKNPDSFKITLGALIVLVFLFIASGPMYILSEGEQAIVARFGRIIKTEYNAGLKFKVPIVDKVTKYPKKIMAWDGESQRIPTREKLFVWVDATARWKIVDPAKFYASVTTINAAQGRLNEIIESSLRTIISQNFLREVVRNSNVINDIKRESELMVEGESIEESIDEGLENGAKKQVLKDPSGQTQTIVIYDSIEVGRNALSEEMLVAASKLTPEFGVELIDIILRQIKYSDDLTESVYKRMIKDRNQIAQAYRSYGEGKKLEWLGRLTNERMSIISEANKKANEIKGQADAEATAIYADAYSKDEEFFEFWRLMESYKQTVPAFNKILSTGIEYFKYLGDKKP